jgi:hypothetical protein
VEYTEEEEIPGKDPGKRKDVPHARPNGLAESGGGVEDTPPEIIPAQAKRGGDFIAAYEPIYYTLDGILASGFLWRHGAPQRRQDGRVSHGDVCRD